MPGTLTLERVLWGTTFLLNAGLVILLGYRRNYRVFPFFSLYVVLNLLQGMALFEVYRIWTFGSTASILVAWGLQFLVILARAFAVAEMCHRVLARYPGIWKFASLLLLVAATFISLFAWAFSQGNWRSAILSLDRGVELAIASVIVVLLFFVRYYALDLDPAVSTIAAGFFLYSVFRVLDNTLVERWLIHSTRLWNFLGTMTFLASLLLWTWALREAQRPATSALELLTQDYYRSLSPAINARLKALNEQLGNFWHAEGKKT
jgi:hypothetical protein